MTSWFEDPKQLIRTDKVLEFWPSKSLSSEERINATARFIIYATCIIYLINRDIRIFVLGGTALGVLYIMEQSDMIKEGPPRSAHGNFGSACQMPTQDNPCANVLMTDYTDRPDRPSACFGPTVQKNTDSYITNGIQYGPSRSRSTLPRFQRNALARQFTPTANSSLGNDPYYEFIHGSKGKTTCRQDPRLCDPDARGVQLEAFAGLDPTGDKRSGMHRGSGLPAGHSA
tara:strand:- start:9044 stop:9730 length:687 start_codon:yes stop_codon:yes gene_type:complete